ncbi:DUF6517 family protein [Natronobacterium texcoconense]|uniref:Uncharacterized protein n=1 Tax=Natronobacterium texcoconense TaxID=1095778 RepID=A0A1H1CIL0_NATTX|nr:DUF6517 family protein [Natronobacterium texcoconense]SDQ63949.1 hypothetical protein SAMN04489842_1417 [Natronobacterium texcoconense]
MKISRRSLLAAGATGTVASTAGCLDFVLGDGPLEFTAARVAPTDAALEETGYEEDGVEEQSFEETVDVGVEREVEASLWASIYTKERELAGQSHEAGVFAAVSVPGMEVAGYSVNPLEEMSSNELLEEFLNEVEVGDREIGNLAYEESVDLSILGESREVEQFSGETEYAGQDVDVEIALTSFNHEGDLLVLLGSYPEEFSDEAENVEALLESVEHPV